MQKTINKSLKFIDLNKLFRRLIIIIPVGIFGNIVFTYFLSDKMQFSSLQTFSFQYFVLAIILSIIPWFMHALRIQVWTNFLGKQLSFIDVFKIVLGTDLASAISPTAIGGAPVKVGMLVQKGMNIGAATSLLTLSSLEDMLFSVTAIPIAMTISHSWNLPILHKIIQKMVDPALYILVGVVAIILLFLFVWAVKKSGKVTPAKTLRNRVIAPRIREKMRSFWDDYRLIFALIVKKGKSRFLLNMMFTTLQWSCRYSVIYALLLSLGMEIDPVRCFVLQWVVFTLMTFIPTPGATAGAEAAFYFIYQSLFPTEVIGLITTGWRFMTFYLLLILGSALFVLFSIPTGFVQKIFKRPYFQPAQLETKTIIPLPGTKVEFEKSTG